MVKLIRESWVRKLNGYLKLDNSNEVLKEIGQKTFNFAMNMDDKVHSKLEKSFFFYTFANVMVDDKTNVILEFKPFYKLIDLKFNGVNKDFFKCYNNWCKLTDQEKDTLEELVSPYYDITVKEMYRYYWGDYLKMKPRKL